MLNHLAKLTVIPPGVTLAKALTRERLEALQYCIHALAAGENLAAGNGLRKGRSRGKVRLDLDVKTRRNAPVYGPFTPLFFIKDAEASTPAYICRVTDGVVIDRETGGMTTSEGGDDTYADGLIYYKCDNRMDDEETQHDFPVTSGDSVFVRVPVTKTGRVGDDAEEMPTVCEIVVEVDDLGKSVHYYPPVSEAEGGDGSAGYMCYKLATFTVVEGEIKVEMFCGGGNIQHYRELPMFKATGITDGVVELFTRYDPKEGKYLYKGIKGVSPIVVEVGGTPGNEIVEVRMDGESIALNFYLVLDVFRFKYALIYDTDGGDIITSTKNLLQYDGTGGLVAVIKFTRGIAVEVTTTMPMIAEGYGVYYATHMDGSGSPL